MSIISMITGNDTPVGEQWVDDRMEEAQQLGAQAVNQVKAWSMDDPDTWTDDALRWAGGAIKGTGNWWQEATADQAGLGDDFLRLAGGGFKNTMKVLDAGSYYGGKVGGSIAEMIGVDARIGGAIGNVTGDLLAGGVFTKATKTVKMGNQLQHLRKLGATDFEIDNIVKGGYSMAFADNAHQVSRIQDMLTAAQQGTKSKTKLSKLQKSLETLNTYKHPLFADILEGNTTYLSKNITGKEFNLNRQFNRVEHMNKETLKTFYGYADNDPYMFDDMIKKIDQAYEHYEKHGTIEGLAGGTKWVNPKTNEVWRIKSKMSGTERVTFGMDNYKSEMITKELRKKYQEVTLKSVQKAAAKIHPNNSQAAEVLAQSYYKKTTLEKKILERLIKDLNKKGPKKAWSLGHGRAVKALRDANSGNADMFTNIELERLVNVLDDKGKVLIRGNSSRGASDELADVINTTLNRSRNIDEEVLKYSYKPLAKFWPKMGKIVDEKSFIREVGKRDAYTEAIQRAYNTLMSQPIGQSMSEAERWARAADSVLDSTGTMNKTKPTFLGKSKYENLKITPDMFNY
tara:strand:- start:45 stop:1754 length:1710 start_codon:yes stop_codon:yes gene_type:complete